MSFSSVSLGHLCALRSTCHQYHGPPRGRCGRGTITYYLSIWLGISWAYPTAALGNPFCRISVPRHLAVPLMNYHQKQGEATDGNVRGQGSKTPPMFWQPRTLWLIARTFAPNFNSNVIHLLRFWAALLYFPISYHLDVSLFEGPLLLGMFKTLMGKCAEKCLVESKSCWFGGGFPVSIPGLALSEFRPQNQRAQAALQRALINRRAQDKSYDASEKQHDGPGRAQSLCP